MALSLDSHMSDQSKFKQKYKYQLLSLSLLPIFFVACLTGAYRILPGDVLLLLWSKLTGQEVGLPNEAYIVFFQVRLPRVLTAILVGSSLSMSGATLQAMFRNPLVDAYVLGLSSAAAFGAALSLTMLPVPIQISAFLFGLLAVSAAYFAAREQGEVPAVSLVLAGVMMSAVFTALLAIIQIMVDPLKIQSIVYWMMGSMHTASWVKIRASLFPMLVGGSIIWLKRWKLNILSLGDREARAVGLNPEKEKVYLITAATLLASSSVALAGVIGLVGLMVPHLLRMLTGPDNKALIPLCLTSGAAYLLLVDTIARTAASYEIPVGIITTLLGAPFFIYLLRKTKLGGWS